MNEKNYLVLTDDDLKDLPEEVLEQIHREKVIIKNELQNLILTIIGKNIVHIDVVIVKLYKLTGVVHLRNNVKKAVSKLVKLKLLCRNHPNYYSVKQ